MNFLGTVRNVINLSKLLSLNLLFSDTSQETNNIEKKIRVKHTKGKCKHFQMSIQNDTSITSSLGEETMVKSKLLACQIKMYFAILPCHPRGVLSSHQTMLHLPLHMQFPSALRLVLNVLLRLMKGSVPTCLCPHEHFIF